MYSKTILPNGLRLVTVPMPAVKSATVLVMVEAGSRYETPAINGISHFLEHLVFKQTKKYPDKFQILTLLDSIGSSHNAFTGKEYTGFFVKAAAEHLELALSVLSDIIINPIITQEDLDIERGTIIEEINMYEDQPQMKIGELFEELLYKDQPLGWPVIGTKEIIQKITRENVLDYVGRMYHTKAMVVGIAGDLSHRHSGKRSASRISNKNERDPGRGQDDGLNNSVNKYFGQMPEGDENKYEPVGANQDSPESLVHYKKTDQAHVCIGVRAYDINHPDRFVLSVLGTILGGNSSSRLFIEVREKRGLAYYIQGDNEEFHDTGYFVTQAGVSLENVVPASKVILEEMAKMRDSRVSEDELRRAKDYSKGKMILALEDSFRVASFYTSQELMRKEIETPEEILEKIEKVTAEDIQRVAKDIFVNQKLNLAIIGPFTEPEKFANLLSI